MIKYIKRRFALKVLTIASCMSISEAAYAGNLDGIEYAIGIAAILLGFALYCWFVVIAHSLRYLRNKPYSKQKTFYFQITLMVMSYLIIWLYRGIPMTQIFGGLFFQIPLALFIIIYWSKRFRIKNGLDKR